MAAKSHTLASADRSLRARNAGLMASAQQAAGKRVSVPSSEPPVSALRRLFATEVEPARTYAENAAAPVDADVPTPGWRRVDGGYTRAERQRRERAAWSNATSPRSIIVFDGRQYRRVVPNEGNRRRRY